jgi:hypothetical protein
MSLTHDNPTCNSQLVLLEQHYVLTFSPDYNLVFNWLYPTIFHKAIGTPKSHFWHWILSVQCDFHLSNAEITFNVNMNHGSI